jgi:hypothetical protein
LEEYFKKIEDNLKKGSITTDVIIPNVKLLNFSSKNSPEFNDFNYLPFYYHLGNYLKPKKVIQIGSKLGLVGACFLKSCKTVEEWTIYEDFNQNYRFVDSNLRLNGCKNILFKNIKKDEVENNKNTDIAFLSEKFDNEKTVIFLEFLWNSLKNDSYLIVDYIKDDQISEIFQNFYFIKNRKPILFNTRYGLGILKR